ncbi:MAG: hypothetical protein GF350_06770 [Chitinivibrionales bacterium]|nr:hypothetical protein [Chitinivibrionales bacterium]
MLRGGDYYLDVKFSLDDRDGGSEQSPVTWTAYPGEEPRLFGGVRITGWEHVSDNIYRTKLDNLPSHVNLDTMTWTLSENGRRSNPARHPNVFAGYKHGFWSTAVDIYDIKLVIPRDEFPDFQDDYHCRFTKGANSWFSQTWPITKIDFSTYQIYSDPMLGDCRGFYTLEGAWEFIDLPGEWAITEDHYLYYWPKHEPIENQTIVLATTLRIIELMGRSDQTPVQHLTLKGLTLSTSDCTKWGLSNKSAPGKFNSDGEEPNTDHDYSRHGLVHLENAENITVTECRILAAGVIGVMLNYHCKYNRIYGNWIEGVNYHGVCLQSYGPWFGPWIYNNCYNTVQNNYIYRTGRLWSNGAGVYLHQSGNNLISQNEIREMPRYGITYKGAMYVGDQRGDFCAGDRQCSEEHIFVKYNMISYNDVSHVIHSTNDCGAIEAWNQGVNDTIAYNLCHDIYHPALDVRCYKRPDDPAGATTPEWRTGGLSHRHGIYPDGSKSYMITKANINYNIVSGAQLENYNQYYTICRSAAKLLAQQKGLDWDKVGLRSDFKWYGQTPATDAIEEEWEFPEEIVHDPEYIGEYLKQFTDGRGLTATYFSDAGFGTMKETKIDSPLVKNWLTESPTGTSQWSVRWEGYFVPIKTERHRFGCETDKDAHCNIWIDDKLVLHDDSWRTQPGDIIRVSDTLTEPLEAYAYYPIKIELSSTERTGFFKPEFYSLTAIPSMPLISTQLYPKDHDISKPPERYGGGAAVIAERKSAGKIADPISLVSIRNNGIHIAVRKQGYHSVKLMSMNGAVINRINGDGPAMHIIDTRPMAAGVYMLVINHGTEHSVQKIGIHY